MTPSGGVPSDNPIAGSRVFAFGIRNSFGFTFDPQTDSLWETENGPECNDEINLIAGGGNFGWGPNENCGGNAPGNTNNSGPTPRRLPKLWFEGTIGITGDAFCDGCGLGSQVDGQLFFGDVNTGVLRRVALNAARDDVSGSAIDVLDAPGGRDLLDGDGAERAGSTSATRKRSTGSRPREARQAGQHAATASGDGPLRRSTLAVVARGTAQPARRPAVDIGQPKRIIEVEPVSLPLPETLPDTGAAAGEDARARRARSVTRRDPVDARSFVAGRHRDRAGRGVEGVGAHRPPRRIAPPAAPGRGPRPALAPRTSGGSGMPDARTVPRSAAPRMHLRSSRHARTRRVAPDAVPRRAGPRGPLGAGHRARAGVPRAVRLPAAARG